MIGAKRSRAIPSTVLAECPSARAYRAGCECQGCKDEVARYERHRTWEMSQGRPRSRSVTGAMRRLQALSAIGWGIHDLSIEGGIGSATLQRCRNGRLDFVLADTHRRICTLYDRLWDQPGPSARARSDAAARGWAPPLAWDEDSIDDPAATPLHTVHVDRLRDPNVDDTAVTRYLGGDESIRLNLAEKAEALRRIVATGQTLTEACHRLHMAGAEGKRLLTSIGEPVVLRTHTREYMRVTGCGTHAGHNWHVAQGEDPCELCKRGERIYNTDRARIRRQERKDRTLRLKASRRVAA